MTNLYTQGLNKGLKLEDLVNLVDGWGNVISFICCVYNCK